MSQPTAAFVETTVTPGTTGVVPLFNYPLLVNSAVITPLDANTGTVAIGTLNPPINKAAVTLPFIPGGKPYDLSKINLQASDTTSGVLVMYINANL